MRIWIDVTNSPHVNFFSPMIEQLRNEHDVLLTCRPLANTIDLLKLKGYEYHVIVSDLLLGLRARDLFKAFAEHILSTYGVDPAFNTMNMPYMVEFLDECGIYNFEPKHEIDDLLRDLGWPGILAVLATVLFLGNESAIPAEHGLW